MAELVSKSFDTPGETRTFDNGKAELVEIAGTTVGRFTFQPGWRWSESVKPKVGTDMCEVHHVGVATSGRLNVETPSGSIEVTPGSAYEIPPGHDAWVVGDEPFTGFEFQSAAEYGKPK